jgi:hypothetical protein
VAIEAATEGPMGEAVPADLANDGPGIANPSGSTVGAAGTVALMLYLLGSVVLLLYCLIQFWPSPTPAGGSEPTAIPAKLFWWQVVVSDEVRLLLIVALSGALGALVHTLRSLYWYVGNRALKYAWVPMYVMTPMVGLTLGLVFYLVFRGGLFSSQATVQTTSPFGFAAMAALVGMFSDQAAEKLKQAASMLLADAPTGADHAPTQSPSTAASASTQQPATTMSNSTSNPTQPRVP